MTTGADDRGRRPTRARAVGGASSDGLGDRGAAGVADEAGDLLDGHAFVGEEGHEAVAQLARCLNLFELVPTS